MDGADLVATALLSHPPPAEHKTHVDRVFEQIERAIVVGEFAPGSRLGEETLAERFGVSRGPLREALRQLEGRGLVVRLPHAGVRVVALGHEDLIELYEIRGNLEGLACRLAAAAGDEAEEKSQSSASRPAHAPSPGCTGQRAESDSPRLPTSFRAMRTNERRDDPTIRSVSGGWPEHLPRTPPADGSFTA